MRGKLTKDQAREIIEKVAAGASAKALAAEYGITTTNVGKIVQRQVHKRVEVKQEVVDRAQDLLRAAALFKGGASLADEQVVELISRVALGQETAAVAGEFGISEDLVLLTVARKRYAKVAVDPDVVTAAQAVQFGRRKKKVVPAVEEVVPEADVDDVVVTVEQVDDGEVITTTEADGTTSSVKVVDDEAYVGPTSRTYPGEVPLLKMVGEVFVEGTRKRVDQAKARAEELDEAV